MQEYREHSKLETFSTTKATTTTVDEGKRQHKESLDFMSVASSHNRLTYTHTHTSASCWWETEELKSKRTWNGMEWCKQSSKEMDERRNKSIRTWTREKNGITFFIVIIIISVERELQCVPFLLLLLLVLCCLLILNLFFTYSSLPVAIYTALCARVRNSPCRLRTSHSVKSFIDNGRPTTARKLRRSNEAEKTRLEMSQAQKRREEYEQKDDDLIALWPSLIPDHRICASISSPPSLHSPPSISNDSYIISL